MSGALSEEQAYLVLNALPGIGPITLNRLIAECGGAAAVLAAGAGRLQGVKGIGAAAAAAIRDWPAHFDLAREEKRLAEAGARFVVNGRDGYSPLLARIHDPPIGLYCRGPYAFSLPSVAIIGSRRTTLYGRRVAGELAGGLARRGLCVVSGLARGIDTAAHEAALEAGGRTAAILGCGLDIIYPPENLDLYRRIAASGVIASEFPFGRKADRQTFPMRNRIISGLCEAIVVVESDESGGSMITARFAGEQGRQVFAVPGRIDQATSRGCHQLIRDGVILCTGVEDILAEMQYLEGMRPDPVGKPATAPGPERRTLSERESAVMACFAGGECLTVEGVAGLAHLPAGEAASALMLLELEGRVRKRLDGAFEAVGPT